MKPTRQNNDINTIKDARNIFNEPRNNLSHEETKRIRKKIRRIEAVHNVLKEKEQKDSLTSRQKNMLRNDERYLKNISMHLKNLKKHFKKLQKYQYGSDCLFNELNEENYSPNNDINVFKEARKVLNERRSNFLCKETKRIRKKLYRIEAVYNVLKEKEQKGSLTSRQKNMLRNDERYLKNISKHLKNLKKNINMAYIIYLLKTMKKTIL